MAVAARFYVQQITKNASGYTGVQLSPSVKGEANKDWAYYTPSGSIQLNVHPDTEAGAWFESMLGKDVSITFDSTE